MMNRRRALTAVLLLAACGSEPRGDAPRGAAPDSAGGAPAAVAAPPADSAGATPAATPAARLLALAENGVEVADSAGAPRRIAFGTPQAGVLAAVGPVAGAPDEQVNQEECPAGPLVTSQYASGLQLVFQDGAFVGWAAESGSAPRTVAGIGPGSTLGQLRAAYPAATVGETSLGTEFTAGDLYGIVSDSTAAGVVEIMFAGINCIFR